jgi:hypothetical protein
MESGKNYTIARHSINLGKGCQITFNFQHMNVKRSQIYISRKNGDGKVFINGILYIIPFNRVKIIDIPTEKVIEIKRELSFIGDIQLASINLDLYEETPIITNESWENLIQNIHSMNGITSNNSGVFASEGAKIIHGEYIQEIETFPSDAFIKNGPVINFIKPCKIVKINSINNSPIIKNIEPMNTKCINHNDVNYNVVNVRKSFEKHSTLEIPELDVNKIELNSSIEFNNYETRLWFYRMSELFTNLNYKSKYLQFHNKQPVNESSIFIGDSNNNSECNKLFINKITELSNTNSYKEIYTNSLITMFQIKKLARYANVKIAYLPWFYIEGNYNREDYCIYFEEDEEYTKQLISNFPSDRELIIVGTNLQLPNNIKSLNKYINYKTLFKYIIEASHIIYLNENKQHKSGLLELAKHFGINIISNNKNYIQSGTFLPNNDFSFMKFNDKNPINEHNNYNEINLEYLKGIIC